MSVIEQLQARAAEESRRAQRSQPEWVEEIVDRAYHVGRRSAFLEAAQMSRVIEEREHVHHHAE